MPDLAFVNVRKKFGTVVALKDLDLHVADGEYAVVLGSTGAGKTTLLRVAAGILEPDAGEVQIDGNTVNDVPPEDREVGYFPQGYALFPHMTVQQNVEYGLRARGESRKEASERALEILQLVGLARRAQSLPSELSGGMQQRVALARAIAPGFKILLLDEPLGALDAILRIELRHELRLLARRLGATVLHVTHDQEEALFLADKLVVMRKGVIMQVGDPREVYDRPDSIFVGNFVGEMNFLEGIVTAGANGSSVFESKALALTLPDGEWVEGRQVVLAVRPEDVRLGLTDRHGENVLRARVVSTTFSGGVYRVRALLPGDRGLTAKTPHVPGFKAPGPDEEVDVQLHPSELLVYPYPPQGLLKALEYE